MAHLKYCKICGKPNCKKHSFLIGKTIRIREFSGSSPPEIFVGKPNYPNINMGILSPQKHGDTSLLSSPEEWHKNKLNIPQIVNLRDTLIYGRTKSQIKQPQSSQSTNTNSSSPTRFLQTMQEIALTHKSISTEFKLKKPVTVNKERDSTTPLITNTAQVERARLQENPKIKSVIDKTTSDTDLKSSQGIKILHKSNTSISHIIKILSAGLLGRKTWRKWNS